MAYCLMAQDRGAFVPFQLAAIVVSIGLFYFVNTVVFPTVTGNPNAQFYQNTASPLYKNWVNYGMMVTGPDSEANMVAQKATLQALTWFTLGCTMSTLMSHFYREDTADIVVKSI